MIRSERVTATALVVIALALILVGLVSRMVARHAVQIGPVLAAALVVRIRPGWARFAALPIFLFWLFIMALIWLYVLGLARIVTGRFTPVEVALTVLIGLACLVGVKSARRVPVKPGGLVNLAVFLVFSVFQAGAVLLSMQPGLEND